MYRVEQSKLNELISGEDDYCMEMNNMTKIYNKIKYIIIKQQ